MTSEPRRENRTTEMRQDRFSPAGAQSTGTVAVRRLLTRLPRRSRDEHDCRIHALARTENLKRILEQIKTQTLKPTIFVWNNGGE